MDTEDRIGVATGLAYTSVGGEMLSIEVTIIEGKGKIILTGKLGSNAGISSDRDQLYPLAGGPAGDRA